jgi:conserved oligomeric Golgi complex subunit 3
MLYQEKSLGKDGGADVTEKESALEETGAMDAVLVNTHQVSFYFYFAPPLLYNCPSITFN